MVWKQFQSNYMNQPTGLRIRSFFYIIKLNYDLILSHVLEVNEFTSNEHL